MMLITSSFSLSKFAAGCCDWESSVRSIAGTSTQGIALELLLEELVLALLPFKETLNAFLAYVPFPPFATFSPFAM